MKPGEILVGLSSIFKDEDFKEVLSSLHFDQRYGKRYLKRTSLIVTRKNTDLIPINGIPAR